MGHDTRGTRSVTGSLGRTGSGLSGQWSNAAAMGGIPWPDGSPMNVWDPQISGSDSECPNTRLGSVAVADGDEPGCHVDRPRRYRRNSGRPRL